MSTEANILKEQGNILFRNGDFKAALDKYTEAIALDEGNPFLWCNRSACHLMLKQYMQACGDALKATQLDSKYYKSYVRLATAHEALQEYLPSASAWNTALKLLPTENLTPTEEKQRAAYTARWEKAKLNIQEKASSLFNTPLFRTYPPNETGHPWDVSAALVVGLREARDIKSSAWVVAYVAKMFDEGVRRMKSVSLKTNEDGKKRSLEGEEDAFSLICDAMLQDGRCIHLEDMSNWVDAYNLYGTLEQQRHNPWIRHGPDNVKREMPVRVQELGWDQARPDFNLTIRFWLLRVMLERASQHSLRDSDAEYARQTLNLLEWGREKFKDVPVEEKGEIFDDVFIRSVRRYYITILMDVYGPTQRTEADRAEWLEPILQQTDLILQELEMDPRPSKPSWVEGERDPGWFLANYDYLKGHAYSCKAFYYSELANSGTISAEDEERNRNNQTAGEFYLKAAECYPIDDEEHGTYLNCALRHLSQPPGCTIREALKLMDRVREAYDAAGKIWRAHPSRRRPEAERSHQALLFDARALREAVDRGGEATLDVMYGSLQAAKLMYCRP